jgi:hypothetical protein
MVNNMELVSLLPHKGRRKRENGRMDKGRDG